jgi:hypothetical protein
LNDAFNAGKIDAVRERLDEIPDGLDDLFTNILTRDNNDIDDLIQCLQLILFAQRSLAREELYSAIIFANSRRVRRDVQLDTDSIIGNFILNVSKGFVEVTRSKARTVQFIHESVRDFLLGRDGFNRLQADLRGITVGMFHGRLVQTCYDYLCQINQEMARDEFENCVPFH